MKAAAKRARVCFGLRRYVHSSRDTFALTKLMSSLNEPLLEELKLHLYKGLVSKANFFKACYIAPNSSGAYFCLQNVCLLTSTQASLVHRDLHVCNVDSDFSAL